MPTTEITKPKEQLDLFVFARNSVEMAKAQEHVIQGVEAKLTFEKTKLKDLETNLELAKKNKWNTSTLKRHVGYAKDRVSFYEKVKFALEAGYQIVPDMFMDVFAVRTDRKKPTENRVDGKVETWNKGPFPSGPDTNSPPLGEGQYVNPVKTLTDQEHYMTKEGEKEVHRVTRWSKDFCEVDFPFQLVKPQVMSATAEAMAKKVFDEMGVLPRRPGSDPMVIGSVTLKRGYITKRVNFVVAWFLDLETL